MFKLSPPTDNYTNYLILHCMARKLVESRKAKSFSKIFIYLPVVSRRGWKKADFAFQANELSQQVKSAD